MKRILTTLVPVFFVGLFTAQAQVVPLGVIRGRVIDDSTHTPLFLANAYVANTVLGSAADTLGRFVINRIPVGPQTLIVSFVGYKTSITDIRVDESGSSDVVIRLKPKQLQAAPVEVTARIPTQWKRDLEKFQRWFLGTSENAQHCRLLNPEILDFSSGGDWIEFEATPPEQPLQIENRALGYKVYYILTRFRYVQKHLETGGVARFEPLVPRDSDEALLWRENRRQAYYGSLRHFLSSLIKRTYEKEGFEISRTNDVPGRYHEDVNVDAMVHPTSSAYRKMLTFRDYLEVTYTKANAEEGYETYEWRVGTKLPSGHQQQTSWILLDAPDVIVDADGNVDGPFVIQVIGYWTFQRIANLLPTDYKP
ncbi:MAG TPA: carboxypeptidase-like regulatory domain-containing protein [Bacteroidota bacterium]